MVKAADIRDRDSLEVWLKDQPREVAISIAARAAARVMPVWAEICRTDAGRKLELTPLPVLRADMVSSVAVAYPADELIRAAAALAAAAADTTGTAAAATAAIAAEADAAYYAANAVDSSAASAFAATSASALDEATALEAATTTAFDATTKEAKAWHAVQTDAATLESGQDLTRRPLWPAENPLEDLWTITREMNPDMLYQIALIDDGIWKKGADAVAEEIARIEAEFAEAGEGGEPAALPLARAYLFDFVEHDRQLRITGVPLDFDGRTPEEVERCLRALRSWNDDLADWLDYSRDDRRNTPPIRLEKAAQKLVDLIEALDKPEDFPAGRLVSMGGNLRLFALDEAERDRVGDTLARMMDARLDELGTLLGDCFAHVLARLEPLHELDLGENDPARLIADIRKVVDQVKAVDPIELAQLDPEGQAVFAEMIRELEEHEAAIAEARSEKGKAVARKRFAEKYGGLSATFGRALQRGREAAGGSVKRFDDAVKWYKRWETLEKVAEWWRNLPDNPF